MSTEEDIDTSDFEETDRFTDITKLEDGWAGEDSFAVPAEVVSEARRLRDVLVNAGVECCVFATHEGGISIEDTADDLSDSFTITINPDLTVLVMTFGDNGKDEEYKSVKNLPDGSPWMSQFTS